MITTEDLIAGLRRSLDLGPLPGVSAMIGKLEELMQIERAALPEAAQKIETELPEAKAQWDSGNPKVCNGVFEWCFDLLLALRAAQAIIEKERAENASLQHVLAACRKKSDAYAQQCGQLQSEIERMDRQIVLDKDELRQLRGRVAEVQRESENRLDCHAGAGTTKEPCKACITCCLNDLEGMNWVRQEERNLRAERDRLLAVAKNLDDKDALWDAVRAMKFGDTGRPIVARLLLNQAAIERWRSCMCCECTCWKCGPVMGPRFSVEHGQGQTLESQITSDVDWERVERIILSVWTEGNINRIELRRQLAEVFGVDGIR